MFKFDSNIAIISTSRPSERFIPLGQAVKILRAFLPSPILAICPAYFPYLIKPMEMF